MNKKFIPLIVVFVLISALLLMFGKQLEAKGFDTDVILIGNVAIFGISILAQWMYAAALTSSKSYGFVRQVYGGFVLKFFALLVLAMVYFYFAKEINKPAVFTCMVIYLIYNFLGTSQVVRKQAKATHPAPQQPHSHKKKHH